MKVISNEHGQVFQQFRIEEVRPTSGIFLASLISYVAARYSFANVPTVNDQVTKFFDGHLVTDKADIVIRELGIYNEGIVVITWNTLDAELILDDLLDHLTTGFDLREPLTKYPRSYVSSIVCQLEASFGDAFDRFSGFLTSYRRLMSEQIKESDTLEVARISFNADPTSLPQFRTAEFLVERRANTAFSENRFFSTAPLQTNTHIELLREFEGALPPVKPGPKRRRIEI